MKPYYEHAGITIFHGDCREVIEQWEGLRTQSFDLLLTDPPYGIGFASQPTTGQRARGQERELWDEETAENGLISRLRALSRVSIIWGGNYYDLPPARCWLSWHKPDAPPSMGNVEYAWTTLDQNSRQISISIAATNAERVGHPTQKPEAVMAWALGQVPGSVRTVFDPFVGSGTTLVVAKRAGRQCIGIEREERYCEIAAKRLAQEALNFDVA